MVRNRPTFSLACLIFACATLSCFAPSARAQAGGAAIDGTYDGTYACAQGPRSLKLSLTALDEHSLSGIFTFYLPPASHDRAFSYSVKGSYDADFGTFTLIPVKWETAPPPGYVMVGLSGKFTAGRVSGTITYSP